jgi:phosphate transport system permease protein
MNRIFTRRHLEEIVFRILMGISFLLIAGSLGAILWTIIIKGLPALTWSMVTQLPKGGYYQGKEQISVY